MRFQGLSSLARHAMRPKVRIYCDGACSPNPGVGGWGVVLLSSARRLELSGAVPDTTNNRMELLSAIESLRALRRACSVVIHMDSLYVLNPFQKGWLATWQRNGWRSSARKPIENQDLWHDLLGAIATHEVEWRWVKGHADDVEHNRCDELAVAARKAYAANEGLVAGATG
jgi:ribonuclease HI